jgi:mono/diheme cytochrome c family protein
MRVLIGLVSLALMGAAQAKTPTYDGVATSGPAQIRHGERLTYVMHCTECHTPALTGKLFRSTPDGSAALWASNLMLAVPKLSDAELRGVLTRGVHPRRGELYSMPADMFRYLAASDLDAIVAYLRTLKPAGEPTPDPKVAPKAKPISAWMREAEGKRPIDAGAAHARGRYIAETACGTCHGPQLNGEEDWSPNLIIAASYSRAEFETLLTTGKASDGREVKEPMSTVAKECFPHLTRSERDALYAYLKARAMRISE